MVKNLLELKNAQRVLIEGNIFEYSWAGFSQAGYLMLLTPKNQSGWCPICEVTDVTIRYNTFSHGGAGISMANVPDDGGQIGTDGERYSIHDITIDDINKSFYQAYAGSASGSLFQVFNAWPTSGQIQHVWINHVTGYPDPSGKVIGLSNPSTGPQMTDFKLINSILGQAAYPIWSTWGGSTDCSISSVPLTSLNTCFPNNGYSFADNVLVNAQASHQWPSLWPAGNSFPTSVSTVQFANFNNGIGGNYTLLSTSPYKNQGLDGKDLGADINAIQTAIAGVY
jgi:hypothetical protein